MDKRPENLVLNSFTTYLEEGGEECVELEAVKRELADFGEFLPGYLRPVDLGTAPSGATVVRKSALIKALKGLDRSTEKIYQIVRSGSDEVVFHIEALTNPHLPARVAGILVCLGVTLEDEE